MEGNSVWNREERVGSNPTPLTNALNDGSVPGVPNSSVPCSNQGESTNLQGYEFVLTFVA